MFGDCVCVLESRFPIRPNIWLSFAGDVAVDGTLGISGIATGLRREFLGSHIYGHSRHLIIAEHCGRN